MKAITLLIVDDQALFREGLRTVLSLRPEVEVVGEAANGAEAVSCARRLAPEVVLMDLRMPVMGGVEATRQILRAQPGCRVIVLTTFEDDQEVFDALHAGAAGYLLKGTSGAQIIEAALAVMRGESCLQPSVAAKVVAEFNRLSRPAPAPPPSKQLEILSQREQDVLRQLAGGKSNKEIAAALGVAEGTVKNHMSSIIAKLEVLDRTQAALKARALGLV